MNSVAVRSSVKRHLWEKDGNCFLWGCVTVIVVFILGSIVAFLGVRFGITQIRENWTDDAAIELPASELEISDVESLIDRVDEFAEGLRNGDALDPLTLTQDDLNALLQNHPEVEEWGEYVYFTIEDDDSLTGQVSVPLDFLPGFSGRYFNGYLEFEASMENGRFEVYVNEAMLNGEPVPEDIMEEVRGANLAEDADTNPEARDLIEAVESLSVVDGVIIITPVNIAGESSGDEAEALGEETAQ